MKRILLVVLCLMILFSVMVEARRRQPADGNGRIYRDMDFYGVTWKIVTDTSTWTTVFNGQGLIYEIYAFGASTWTANTNYFRAATDTNTVVVPDFDVVGDTTRIGNITDAISFVPTPAIYSSVGLKVKPGPCTDTKAAGAENETTIYILYLSR